MTTHRDASLDRSFPSFCHGELSRRCQSMGAAEAGRYGFPSGQGCRSMTQDDTDQQLVRRVQAGDKSRL